MVVTIVCRDTINCKVTIVLCNRAQVITTREAGLRNVTGL